MLFVQRCKLLARPRQSARAIALLLIFQTLAVRAELPLARLNTIFPLGGQAGTTVELAVAGPDLDEARHVLFSNTNITARPKPGAHTGEVEPNRFLVTIGSNVTSGAYEARVIGRFGITNPRIFTVSTLREIHLVNETNHTAADALSVPIDCVVNSRAVAAQIGYFRFAARKGQRVLVECATQELESKMDARLTLDNAQGHELEVSRGRGLIDFTPTEDGEFWLKVHDSEFRGGEDYGYRLKISTQAHIDYVVPAAGLAGKKSTFTLYGRNLPGATDVPELKISGKSLQRLDVEIELPASADSANLIGMDLKPASARVDAFPYRLETTNGISNPVLIGLATTPVVREHEPNNLTPQAQQLEAPVELDGRFYPGSDRDWARVALDSAHTYSLEVISQRLGLPTSPFLLVQQITEKGNSDLQEVYASDSNVGGVECNTSTRDVSWLLKPKRAGQYLVEVRDLFNSFPPDPRRGYRLVIRPETPDFSVIASPQAPPIFDRDRREARVWTPFLRAGETIPIKVVALRRDGFDGPIQVSAEDLPAGVSFSPTTIEAGHAGASLFLTASEGVKDWVGPIRVVGQAKSGSSDLTRIARNATVVWDVSDYNTEAVQSRLMAGIYLAVTGEEKAPARLLISDQNTFEAHPGAKLEVPFTLVSQAEVTGNLKVKAAGAPALDNFKEIEINSKTNRATLEIDLAQHKLPLGTHRLYLVGQTTVKYTRPLAAGAKDKAAKPSSEDRSVTIYSSAFTVNLTPTPAATTAAAK